MIEALIAGERNPGRLAGLALGRLRRKTEELQPLRRPVHRRPRPDVPAAPGRL